MDLPLRWTVSGISPAIFALAVAGLIAFGAGQASASHVSCGDEITADTTLDSDLVNCESNGIVIGADGVCSSPTTTASRETRCRKTATSPCSWPHRIATSSGTTRPAVILRAE